MFRLLKSIPTGIPKVNKKFFAVFGPLAATDAVGVSSAPKGVTDALTVPNPAASPATPVKGPALYHVRSPSDSTIM